MKTTLLIAAAAVASFAAGMLTSCTSNLDARAPIPEPPIGCHISGGAK